MEREKRSWHQKHNETAGTAGDIRGDFDEEKFMKLRSWGFLGMLLLAASVGVAHGNKKHVTGTIEKITPDSVVVKTAEGASVEVKLVATTAYILHIEKTDKPAKAADLAVGQRVVIHATSHVTSHVTTPATPNGETLEADEIKFSTSPSTHATAPTSAKPKS